MTTSMLEDLSSYYILLDILDVETENGKHQADHYYFIGETSVVYFSR